MEKKDEQFFKDLMCKSDLKMPFPDFEDDVMTQIEKNRDQQHVLSGNLKLSWAFFAIGTIFGIALSLILPTLDISVGVIGAESISLVFQICFVLFVMLQLESLLNSTKRSSSIKDKDLSLRSR